MMSEDTTSQFIASLVKSLQALCHGYVDFQKNIEIIGHIYINVDSQQKFDYIVNEQVCKNDDESPAMFVSNSFHAMPNRKPVRTFLLNDSPLDLKTHAAKDVTGVDLSTFQPDTGQGRSASRESSQSLSAGSEAGSFSGSLRESSLSSSRQNPENYVSRRKRHLNDISSKLSPTVSPPPSRNRDGERREPRDSPSLRSQYTLGASASKLARRISNELEKQALTNPVHHVQSDSEIHSRLASSNHSPSRHGRHDNSVTYHRHYSGDSSKQIDSVKDPPLQQDGQPLDDSIDLTRVKEEVIDEEQLFDQLDWTRAGRETDQEQAFPRTGPDDPATEGRHANQNDQTEGEDLSSASLYPVMIHQNTAGLPGYGSPVFPQNFTEPSHTMSAGSSPIPSTSGQLSPGSAFPARRPQPGNSGRGYNTQLTPRPGKVPQDVAAKFNMVELSLGRGIFVFPLQIARARNKVSSTACANYLLNCFYTTSEILGSNLTGVNNKKLLDPQIITSILEFTTLHFPGADVAMLKRALRNKITAAECRVKKKAMAQMAQQSGPNKVKLCSKERYQDDT